MRQGLLENSDRDVVLSVWQDRFAIDPVTFSEYALLATSRTVYIVAEDVLGLDVMESGLKIQMAGMPFVREVGRFLKPVTCAIQRFGHLASRNVAELSMNMLCQLCHEGEIRFSGNLDTGFVIISTNGHVWGAGLFLEPDRLLCRLPKAVRSAVSMGMSSGLSCGE